MIVNLTKLLERLKRDNCPPDTTGHWGNYDMKSKTAEKSPYSFRLEKESFTLSTGPK